MKSLTLPVRESWLTRLDPRTRLLLALSFVLLTVSLQKPAALLAALILAGLMAMISGLGIRQLTQRLIAVEAFMTVLMLTLPFTIPGEHWFALGPLNASIEGATRALTIFLKANAVVVILLTLIGTLEPTVLGHALARLKAPLKLVHLLLFTTRYLGVLQQEYQRLLLAMRARAFVPASTMHSWRTFGTLTGMLLVRSLERSNRVHAAMKCRGFNNRLYLIDDFHWQRHDTLALTLWLLPLLALLTLELTL